jgi:hypothetical protein
VSVSRRSTNTTIQRNKNTKRRTTKEKPSKTSLKTRVKENLSGSNLLSLLLMTGLLSEEDPPRSKERAPPKMRNLRPIWAMVR